MKPWKRIEPTIVQKVGWRTIVTKTYELPNGKVDEFQTVNDEDWKGVAVIALTPENKVIIARQFRAGPAKIMEELPGGMADKGEDPEVAIRREFIEETGYEVGSLQRLGILYYDTYSNGERIYYLATNCQPTGKGQQLEYNAFIEIGLITIDQLIDNARNGKMTDPGAVLLAYDELQKRRVKK